MWAQRYDRVTDSLHSAGTLLSETIRRHVLPQRRMLVNRLNLLLLAATVAVAACSDSSSETPLGPTQPDLSFGGPGSARVTNANDAGPGSFRAAIDRANTNPSIGRVEFRAGLAPIGLVDPVVYTGTQALDIAGNGAILEGAGLGATAPAAFLANGGGNLSVAGLTVQNAPQEGLTYQVPAAATGIKKVVLVGVQILGNRGHGVLVNDQVDPIDTSNPNGSDASLDVLVVGSRFAENGFGDIDRDGLRINEGGTGNLNAIFSVTRVDHNGADGIELDERGVGDVTFNVSGTQITRNGSYDVTLADLDDGMDVDESGDGALIGKVFASAANDNYEEGWDFNENDAGDFRVDMTLAEASRNLEEGIDFEEDDDFQGGGDLITTLIGIKANGNGPGGDAGLKIRERGDGNIDATIRGAETNGNLTGGISLREQGTGDLTATIERATSSGNGTAGIAVREDDAGILTATIDQSTSSTNAGIGIDFDENSTGDLVATVKNTTVSTNTGGGIRADQGSTGIGSLALITVTLTGNIGGTIVNNAGVTVTQTP